MSMPSQQYAESANSCDEDREVGVRRPGSSFTKVDTRWLGAFSLKLGG